MSLSTLLRPLTACAVLFAAALSLLAQTASASDAATQPTTPRRSHVLEVYTGTWCPYCPRAVVAERFLADQYPQELIVIAVHRRDNMSMTDGSYDFFKPWGYPTARVNRSYESYLTVGETDTTGVQVEIRKTLAQAPVAQLSLSAVWSADETDIELTTQTTFLQAAEGDYALGYVLTADSIWAYQVNAFNKADYMLKQTEHWTAFVGKGDYVWMPQNHVLVAADHAENGIDGSITTPLSVGQPQTHRQTFVRASEIHQDGRNYILPRKEKITAIALLIDRRTGQIANAAKAHVRFASQVTGVHSVLRDDASASAADRSAASAAAAYDLLGRRLSAGGRGLRIEGGKKVLR